MNPSHYQSKKLCKKPKHIQDGFTLRYKSDNKCVLCRKECRTVFKNCCPMPTRKQQIENYIKAGKFDQSCKEWWGSLYSNGYGHFGYYDKDYLAHRYAYACFLGVNTLNKKALVCHTCDNPKCVNPLHLFLGSHSDNKIDCISKNRHNPNPLKGEKHPKSKLTNNQTKEIRAKYRPRKYTQRMLAREYNVSVSLITKIVGNKIRV